MIGNLEMTEEVRKKIEFYGREIDRLSIGEEYDELKHLIDDMKSFAQTDEEVKNDVSFNYYIGTGYGTYSNYVVRSGSKHTDQSVIDLRRQSMFYLRKGIALYDPTIYSDQRAQLRILTNYANGLDTVGRCLEALRIYRMVLGINDSFSIALGNYGTALKFLANMVNDGGHYKELHCYAYQAIKRALTIDDPDLHELAQASFQCIVDKYESIPSRSILTEDIVYTEYELGKTGEEKEYRTWCLKNHLFLNPLNEVMDVESAFAHDPLTITELSETAHYSDSVSDYSTEPPRWFAMLNQLKEEYIYARYLCFEGLKKGDVHFADRDVVLSIADNSNIIYSIRIESLKSSFHILYSMFDQICYFINDYWELGFEERRANAYNICKAQNYPKDNYVLFSLYWVLCEFYEKYGNAETAYEKDLAVLRNAIEHKYLKVHQSAWDRKLQSESDNFYHITENDLKKCTMRLLEITREALMYLVYAVGVDNKKKSKSENAVSILLDNYLDEWKR